MICVSPFCIIFIVTILVLSDLKQTFLIGWFSYHGIEDSVVFGSVTPEALIAEVFWSSAFGKFMIALVLVKNPAENI